MGGSRFLTDCVMARFAAVKHEAHFASSNSTWPRRPRSSRFAIKPGAKSAIPTDLRAEKLGIREKLGLHEDVRLYDSIISVSFKYSI